MSNLKQVIIILLLMTGMTSSTPKIIRNDLVDHSNSSQFYVSFTYYNHASRSMEGTWSHEIKDGIYSIKNTRMFASESKVLYRSEVGPAIANRIAKIGIENLKDFYHNFCVLPTSGNEYFVTLKNYTHKYSISMHHYYLREIESLVSILNELTPEEYKIWYHSSENKQDCK